MKVYYKKKNILVCILSSKANNKLWDKLLKININKIIIYGDPEIDEPFIFKNNILTLKCGDTFDYLPVKVYQMIKAIKLLPNFNNVEYILKINDTDEKITSNLENNLNFIKVSDYCGYCFHNSFDGPRNWHFDKCPIDSIWKDREYTGKYVPWFDGSNGYLLSRKSMNIILENNLSSKEIYENYIYEDVMIALILRSKNIYPDVIEYKEKNVLACFLSSKTNEKIWPRLLNYNIKSIIIIGDPQLKQPYLFDNNILSLKCGDTYDYSPVKIYLMIKAILEIDEFKNISHILKIDDNNFNKIKQILDKIKYVSLGKYSGLTLHNNFYGPRNWHFHKCPECSDWINKEYSGKYVPWLDGGDGYILSRDAMNSLMEYKLTNKYIYENYIYEDVMIALFMRNKNIFPHKIFNEERKLLVCFLSCKKNQHLWERLSSFSFNKIIFCGDPNIDEPYILNNNILTLKCGDTYDYLPVKIFLMIRAVLEIPEFKNITHILKIDDWDTKIDDNIDKKIQFIDLADYSGQNIHRAYGGPRCWHFNKCPKKSIWHSKKYEGKYVPWLDGGCGYILTKNAMSVINQEFTSDNEVYNNHIYEDVMVALILRNNGIYPKVIEKIIIGDKNN